jgi:hypothetical protein
MNLATSGQRVSFLSCPESTDTKRIFRRFLVSVDLKMIFSISKNAEFRNSLFCRTFFDIFYINTNLTDCIFSL